LPRDESEQDKQGCGDNEPANEKAEPDMRSDNTEPSFGQI